jgi:hypothetical protein
MRCRSAARSLHETVLRRLRTRLRPGGDRPASYHATRAGDDALCAAHARRPAKHRCSVRIGKPLPIIRRRSIKLPDETELREPSRVRALEWPHRQIDQAVAAATALALAATGQPAQGRRLRWLSRLAWFRGRGDDARRHGEAVECRERSRRRAGWPWPTATGAAHMMSENGSATAEWGARA